MGVDQLNVVVINAAPRKTEGNTQVILNPFLVGMREKGARLQIVQLADLDINPCIGCFTCYADTPGECIHQDDMPALTERLRSADMMVLATPVYLDGMTSWGKIFVDRLVTCLDPHFQQDDVGLFHPLRGKLPKKIFLVSVCGFPGASNFEPLVLHVERIARNLNSEFCGALVRPAVFSMLMTKKFPDRIREVLDAVKSAGVELAEQGYVSKQTLEAASSDICSVEELMNTANSYWDRLLADS
jgi:multimeric flavodoxin WrbA